MGVEQVYLNDRHLILPRQMAPMMLSSWERLVNGSLFMSVYQRFGPGVMKPNQTYQQIFWRDKIEGFGLHQEQILAFMVHDEGVAHLIRQLPLPAYVLCKERARGDDSIRLFDEAHSSDSKAMLASGQISKALIEHVARNTSLQEDIFSRKFSCLRGGPKYAHEGVPALRLAQCMDNSFDSSSVSSHSFHRMRSSAFSWSCDVLWRCWCSRKVDFETDWIVPAHLLCMDCLAMLPTDEVEHWMNLPSPPPPLHSY